MRKISSYIPLLAFLITFSGNAQFGNEWIDFSQSYYKIKVVKEDLYRVTQAELVAAGFPVASVSANRIQLFRDGVELAINVESTGNVVDYFEFYGQGLDGKGDVDLYDSGDQPHTLYNLFSDTAVYYLTYKQSNEDGKRMPLSSDNDSNGLTAEAYHLADTALIYTSNYASGTRFGSNAAFSLSKYDNGEGWTGSSVGKGGFTNHDFILTNRVLEQDPICDLVLVGRNSRTHNANIGAGPDASSLSSLQNIQFNAWGYNLTSFTIPETSIGIGGELTLQVLREGFPGLSDFFSVSLVRLQYAQEIAIGSNENKIFTLDNPVGGRAFVQIATTNAENTSVYDISDPANPIRLAKSNFSNRLDVVVPSADSGHKILAVANPTSVETIQSVSFNALDLSNTNYLIITHPDLRLSGDPVNDYKVYRESETGGSHRAQITEIQEIYDLFNYGHPSPLAIERFIRYAATVASAPNTLDNIFIIGKGFTPNFDYYRGVQSQVNIPTYGLPASDFMYTRGIGSDPELPGIAIGRLNAFSPENVTAYLDKVIEMEAVPFNDLSRKDFLQLSGGISDEELETFAGYIEDFSDILETDFIGGRSFNTGKETGESVEFVDVSDRVNQGVGYITFFGHSSGTVTDIEIGRVSNSEFGFSNKGKYPIFLVNGCKAGEIFGNNFTFGEDWMITPDLGSIGFIAHADFASANTLRGWSNLFYNLGFADDEFIGETVGNVLLEVSRQYIAQFGGSNSSLTQVQQMLYQGDPAYRIFGADHPDYQIDNTSIFASAIEGDEILASQERFELNIVTKNFGRSVNDSLFVQIDRTLSDGTVLSYVEKFLRPLRLDTLSFLIPNDPTQVNTGLNSFQIILDPENVTTELDELNNTATFELSIFEGNTAHLFPADLAVLSNDQVEMIWQSGNLLEDERTYDLEIDTAPTFDSPNRRLLNVTGELLLRQSFDFSSFNLVDTSTIYWRTRFSNPEPDENDIWVSTSFTLVDGIESGWGQYDQNQLADASISGVAFNQSSGQWEFIQTNTPLDIFTFGVDHPTFSYSDIHAIVGGVDFMVTSNTIDPVCQQNTFNAIAFNRESGNPYVPIQTTANDVFNNEVCGRLPQRIYNFDEGDILVNRRLQVLVDNMSIGDQIVLFNMGNVTYSNWDAEVEATLNSLGISSATINNLIDGQPVIFFGRKGDVPGSAIEIINDGSLVPETQQSLQLVDDANGSFTSGTIKTQRIGPALDWLEYSFNISEESNDTYSLNVFGVDQNGQSNVLPEFERARAETIDVSAIDASQYPEIELEFSFNDPVDLTAPQLNFWQLNYSLPPDGLVVPEDKGLTPFQEGEEISRNLFFYNHSARDFTDSLNVEVRLVNQQSGDSQMEVLRIAGPLAGDSTNFTTSFQSFGYTGLNSLLINVLPTENEMYDFNNRLTLVNLIEVNPDETNPVLDVTFDGTHILDGDIVSPSPNIGVRMRDHNPFLFKNDTSGITLSIRAPGEGSIYQRVYFSDPALTFTSASESQDFEMNYTPGILEDGVYGLRVQVEDESGNSAGTEPYEITFEVINASTVTHFYPYPNPFSTSCRFVFTLTGSEIPDQIKIQILTVSGRVVREITQDEIGTVRVGNNITDYAWDGRDEFGDQLSNGVYFYRVFVNANGQSLNQRATSADGAFKNGFGKLYILR